MVRFDAHGHPGPTLVLVAVELACGCRRELGAMTASSAPVPGLAGSCATHGWRELQRVELTATP